MWNDSRKKKVLFLSYKDFAGSGLKLCESINEHSDIYQARFVALNPANFGAKNDVITKDKKKIQKWVDEADVVHLKGDKPADFYRLNLDGKVVFHTVGGSEFRKKATIKGYEGVHLSSITPDLTDTWTPHAIEVDKNIWKRPKKGEKIRVGHAPSDRGKKGTNLFLEVISTYENIELVLMENMHNNEVLKLKKTLHLFCDQFILPAYGMNTAESLAYGIPTVSSCKNIEGCPIFRVEKYDYEGIKKAVDLALKNLTQATSNRMFDWAKEIHSKQSVCQLLESYYANYDYKFVSKVRYSKKTITIITPTMGMEVGEVKTVKKWIANDLIKRGIAE